MPKDQTPDVPPTIPVGSVDISTALLNDIEDEDDAFLVQPPNKDGKGGAVLKPFKPALSKKK